jgi:hypothetical protein
MPELQRPRAAKGMLCPFLQKDLSQVCHKCMLWQAIVVQRIVDGKPQQSEHWDCTLKHTLKVTLDLGQATHELSGAVESTRNQANKDSGLLAHTLAGFAAALTAQREDSLRLNAALLALLAHAEVRQRRPDAPASDRLEDQSAGHDRPQ